MPNRAPTARPYLGLFDDVSENRASSAIPDLSTVGEMRAALDEVEAWADGIASTSEGVCFQRGAQDCLREWLGYARHLLRKLADGSIADEVPNRAIAAMNEVASFAVAVAYTNDMDADTVPHLKEFFAANT